MKHILTVFVISFIFVGCFQKQVVQLKMPVQQQVAPVQKVDEDKKTIVEEFISNDTIIQEEIIDNSRTKNEIKQEDDNFTKIDFKKADVKLAFVYPSSLVSKYAKNSINTVLAYLSFVSSNYNLVVIDSINESLSNIEKAFDKVREENITKVIALYTPSSINTLSRLSLDEIYVYLPLIEKKEALQNNDNLIFGSLSYEEQLKKLSYYSEGSNVLFYQDTYLGTKLKNTYENVVPYTIARKEIRKSETNFKHIVLDQRLNNSSIFLNTDIVKSSLILSQLYANEIHPKIIFSTQINFDPMLMTLTQTKDREKLILANSIEDVDARLRDEVSVYGGDIIYEWVDYSTLVGTNYLLNGNNDLIPTKIVDNQANYNTRLFKSMDYGFVEIK